MTIFDFFTRLFLAFVLGAAIGLERQWRQKIAGLRTNTLVAVGSSAFTLISASLTSVMDVDGLYRGDATRIIGQIITGIGFLGAGVIMRDGLNIQGLNTAATIWCSAAVGSLAGVGLLMEAVMVAAFIMGIHVLLRPVAAFINRLPADKEEPRQYLYHIRVRCREVVENHIRILIVNTIKQDKHLVLHSLKSSDNGNPAFSYVEAELSAFGNHDAEMESLASLLTLEYGVTEVSWEINGQQND